MEEDERASGWQRRAEESKLSDGGWVGSGNGERNKKELAGTKRKPRLWGVVVVNPHPRVRSATTLPPVLSLSAPLPPSQPLVLFPSSSGSRLLWRLPSSSVYISSFLKFLNIRSIGSRSLGKNWVGRHEMSAVGTAVSPSPPASTPLASLSARKTHRRCFREDLSVFHRKTRRLMPPRVFELIIRFPPVAPRSVFACSNAIARITSL